MAAGPVPLPPIDIASSSSAGASTGGFSIGGLNFTPNAQSQSIANQGPLIVTGLAAVGLAVVFLLLKKKG